MSDRTVNIDVEKVIIHWKVTSHEDYNTMINLYNSKTYHWSLFMGHISTEKLLKAYYVKAKRKHAPPIHNLYRLAELSDIEISDEHADWLDTITSFNINARYDDFKREVLEMDIEDFDELSTVELFKKILELDATKVVVKGVRHNHQEEKESIIFSKRY